MADVQYNTTTYVGCYSSAEDMSKSDTFTYQSYGHCQEQCIPKSGEDPHPVMGLNRGSDCWCGFALPPKTDKVDDSQCDTPCTGFGEDNCGGDDTYSVYLTGYDNNVGAAEDSSSGSNSDNGGSSTSHPPLSSSPSDSTRVVEIASVITKAGETIIITASGQANVINEPSGGDGDKGSGGSSKVGIAVGVVVGILVLSALIGGGIYFMRLRKRKAVEEEYRRNQGINTYATSDKTHSKGGSADQRLDPSILHHRRQSDGSIADEMDYSRRILQVRNPDSV